MTLNGVALILRYFTEFDSFAGGIRHSNWRETCNVGKISSPVIFGQNWSHHAAVARPLFDSWASCLLWSHV